MESMTKQKEVKKHAATIHCSNSLSLLQRKISNVLLYNAYREMLKKEEHNISINQLCKILAINTHNYVALKDALRALVRTVIEWNLVDDNTGDEDWSATTVLASVRLKGSICYYSYSPRMRELLFSPSIYGKINLVIQSRFKSSYALALYENCVRYKNIGGSKWFNINEFRKIMGISDHQYLIFRDLKRRVIDKAIEEVNTYSDIILLAEYKKNGRATSFLKFIIKDREKKPRLIKAVDKNEIDNEKEIILQQLVQNFGVSKEMAKTLIKEYSVDYIQCKVQDILTSQQFKYNKIKDLAGYTVAAIKKNFQPPISPREYIEASHGEKSVNKNIPENSNTMNEIQANDNHKYKCTLKYLERIDGQLRDYLIDSWLKSLEKSTNFMSKRIKRLYKDCGFTHAQVNLEFRNFLSKNHAEYYLEIISLD